VKSEARLKFDVYPSIYANSWVVQEYKRRGGGYSGVGTGLTKWYGENWVDLARSTDKDGNVIKWHECGRPRASKRAYPKCVPLAKARSMSPEQRKSAIRRKREAERKAPLRSSSGGARSPKMVRTKVKGNPDHKIKKVKKYVEKIEDKMHASSRGAAIGTVVGGVAGMALGPAGTIAGAAAGGYVGGRAASREVERRHAKKKPTKNPKPFDSRPHNWDEILIQRKPTSPSGRAVKITRGKILGHYMKFRGQIWPFLKGQNVMVIIAAGKNNFVRRRNGPDGKYIKLTKLKGADDPRSFEYWIKRRVVEFHPTLMNKRTRLVWVDLDAHESKGDQAMKKALKKMKSVTPKVKRVLGMHVEGVLPSARDVDGFRARLRDALHEAFQDDADIVAKGAARPGQVKLDTSTLHRLGSLRAPFSMTVEGGYKKPI